MQRRNSNYQASDWSKYPAPKTTLGAFFAPILAILVMQTTTFAEPLATTVSSGGHSPEYSATDRTLKTSSYKSEPSGQSGQRLLGFIEFAIGEYRQLEEKPSTGRLIAQLITLPGNVSIQLTGHSYSRGDKASEKLALIRARSVKDLLVEKGINAQRIRLAFDVANAVATGNLVHGVSIELLPTQAIEPLERPWSIPRERETNKPDAAVPVTQPPPVASQALPLASTTAEIAKMVALPANQQNCAEVIINQGSLGNNIAREISECGYSMGQWRFGSEDELIDWDVPIQYSTVVENGIIGLLELIERNYQIRAHIHQLDQSVDFLPSIQDRGNRSQ